LTAELADLGASAAAAAIRNRRCSAEELLVACLERVNRVDSTVHAFVEIDAEKALEEARACDRVRDRHKPALHGVPVAVKEVFDVKGMHCSWGTPIHRDRVPQQDAGAVERLRAAGAVIFGITVSTEYAIAAAGPTANPYDATRTPGGSSSGSAAAVAARMVPLALGSQTIGSIVRPATYCGVLGLKPTSGAISTYGAMPLSEALDHVGAIARELDDVALACSVLFGRDPRDPHSRSVDPPTPVHAMSGVRVLAARGPLHHRLEPASHTALARATQAFATAGMIVEPLELPAEFEQVEECVFTILCRDMARHHGHDRERAGELMSARLCELIDRGRTILDSAYQESIASTEHYRAHLLTLLTGNTVILAPATDGIAPPLTEGTGSPLLQGLWTLTGLPALAVPCGRVEDLPIGVQLIAAPGREDLVLRAARALADVA
jgi:Asp-tRNA(Asn)/Glu-tRNA(Gln) amidotransferase A subunit family amidase